MYRFRDNKSCIGENEFTHPKLSSGDKIIAKKTISGQKFLRQGLVLEVLILNTLMVPFVFHWNRNRSYFTNPSIPFT